MADAELRNAVMGFLLGKKTPVNETTEVVEEVITEKVDDDSILTQLSALEHEQWMSWAKDILKTEDIAPERAERWKELFIPYEDLDEEQKEKDREWARKVLSITSGSHQTNAVTNESIPHTDLSDSLNLVIESQHNLTEISTRTVEVENEIKDKLGTIVDFSIMKDVFG